LAAATLVTTLLGTAMLDPSVTLAPSVRDALDTFTTQRGATDS
jgi:hypothetical protein